MAIQLLGALLQNLSEDPLLGHEVGLVERLAFLHLACFEGQQDAVGGQVDRVRRGQDQARSELFEEALRSLATDGADEHIELQLGRPGDSSLLLPALEFL